MLMLIVRRPLLHAQRPPRQAGATLLEVLVTIVVISFGLLGIAGLLLSGISASTFSNYRSVAVARAYELTDRIRGNLNLDAVGKYGGFASSALPTSASPDCSTADCTPLQLATWDLYAWNKAISDALPSGVGCIRPWPGAPSENIAYEISVRWVEKKSGKGDTDATTTACSDNSVSDSAYGRKSFVLRFEP